MSVTIITNNQKRDVTYGHELTEKEREEFDYLDWEKDDTDALSHFFARYKGEIYDLDEFIAVTDKWYDHGPFKEWDGVMSDSFFSGILVKYDIENEQVIMGRYYS